jgi:Flp pilus assembly pilin Flp
VNSRIRIGGEGSMVGSLPYDRAMTAPATIELSRDPGSSSTPVTPEVTADRSDEQGQGLVEYALILMLVAVVLIIAVQVLGSGTTHLYTNIQQGVHTATG